MDFDEMKIPGASDIMKSLICIECRNLITGDTQTCLLACRRHCGRVQCFIVHCKAVHSAFPGVIPELALYTPSEFADSGYSSLIDFVDAEISRDLFVERRYEIRNVVLKPAGATVMVVMSNVRANEFKEIVEFLDPIVWLARQMNLL